MKTTLAMSTSSAAMAISLWTGLCYLTPLLSAYCADAKWGRAKTLVISQYIFFVGMFLIAISTSVNSDNSCFLANASREEASIKYSALYFLNTEINFFKIFLWKNMGY